MEKTLVTSAIGIKNSELDKIYLQRTTNELINKILGSKKFKISYFETAPNCDDYLTEGMIIEYGDEVYIVDESYGYISKYVPSTENTYPNYTLSRFNWPGDNVRASRAGLVSDYMLTGFSINTSEYFENPKNYQNEEFYHIMKLRFLFANPDFRLNDFVTDEQFLEWTSKQLEFKIIMEEPNKEWFGDKVNITGEVKVNLSEIEKKLEATIPDDLIDKLETAQIYYGGNSEEFREFAKDIPLGGVVSNSSEDTVRVYKEFDLGSNDWELDYIYSFKYGCGSYLMKLKTDTFGRIECILMVLHGTQWVNVQLNDLLLDVRSDSKKSKSVVIETYKKEIMNFIDFFEVN